MLIRILVNTKVLFPGESGRAPHQERFISPVIVPDFSFKERWRRYVKVYLKISYLVMPERI